MVKILVPIALSILIIGCSSDKEPLAEVKEESSVVKEETVSKPGELTELDKCLSRVGMSRETTTSDMSLIDVASDEIMAMDRDTHMGTDYAGYDHECLDLYLEYINTTDYDNVDSDVQDDGAGGEYEDIDWDAALESEETLDFNISAEPLYNEAAELFQTQLIVISKNNEPVTITNVVINRGNSRDCTIMRTSGSSTMNFGEKLTVFPYFGCKVNDIIEVGISTTSGEITYTF